MNKTTKIMIILIAMSFSTFATGEEIAEGTYHNEYIGLHFPTPTGWYLATNAEIKQGIREAIQIMGLDSPEVQSVVKQMPGKVLIMMSEYPFNNDSQDFNRNVIVAAIDVRDHRDEIRTAADFLRFSAEGIKECLPDVVISAVKTQNLGGVTFHKIEVKYTIQDITVRQIQMARIANDYLVVINISAENSVGLNKLMQIADGLRFSPVSQAVDSSTTGQAFRKKAALNLSSSSGSLLKYIGIALIVFGFLSATKR